MDSGRAGDVVIEQDTGGKKNMEIGKEKEINATCDNV